MRAGAERLFELLSLRATEGLGRADRAELGVLLPEHPDIDEDGFDRAAAAVHLALSGPERSLPDRLRRRILADSRQL